MLPSDDAVSSIVAHLAHMRAEHGEVLRELDLVEPNGDYFPDAFAVDPAGIERLLQRMLTYAPLSDDLDVELGFVEGDGSGGGGGCGSGACSPGETKAIARGTAVETEGGYGVVVNVADVGDPTILTASLARSVGRLVLFEAGEEIDDTRDEGALSELTAVSAGLGLLLFNGACVYKKGCGGMRRHQATHLGLDELALALALYVRVTERKAGVVRRHLEVTQRESFDEALAWVDEQPKLVRTLRDEPEKLVDGVFEREGKKGLLSRLFTRSETDDRLDDAVASAAKAKAKARSPEEVRRLAEARALVEEALQE